ncbi:hypothetical protein [Paenibacillus radicis (ex Xue et al. 2023)]|uniref:Spore coat protein n=1 Tax=Paenibacillus radicis (ex Xue et al. 2023) TaxID=2972489 RepID=A0ABT1YTM0_9BACL|nr:hypothetical protein [Paenibacillus radicis (ex Xue et al. 2023)]MCR8636531.1 hypothetical protein [Paenibacillus radicis (ex Xue et al. 2023)]
MAFCPDCPTKTIFDPPVTMYENHFHPQLVEVIHPIEIINQHHCVPHYEHIYTATSKDVMCSVSSVKQKKNRAGKKVGISQRKTRRG